MVPAKAAVGNRSTCTVVILLLVPQKLLMLHCNVLVPAVKPVTVALGLAGWLTDPPPPVTDQVPAPWNGPGTLPARITLGDEIHTV